MKTTKRQLRKIIKEAFNSMSPSSKALANSTKRKFMKLYPDAKVGIDGREGWITVNGKKAVNMSQASGRPLSIEDIIDQMKQAYLGHDMLSQEVPELTGGHKSSWQARKEKELKGESVKITKRQLRKIIREAIDVVNQETGEVFDFGEESGSGLPDKALSDLVSRLSLNLSPNGTLSNDDFQKLEDEVMGKQLQRGAKRAHARAAADRERLNIDNLLQRLQNWAHDYFQDYAADNPGTDLQDVALDLAKSAEYEFEADEWEELIWHFDQDENALNVYTAESMG